MNLGADNKGFLKTYFINSCYFHLLSGRHLQIVPGETLVLQEGDIGEEHPSFQHRAVKKYSYPSHHTHARRRVDTSCSEKRRSSEGRDGTRVVFILMLLI